MLEYTFCIIMKLRQSEIFYHYKKKKTQNALNVRDTRTFTLEGRIYIFKTLRISKIVHSSLIKTVSNSILNEIQKIQKAFLWYSSKPKINCMTHCDMFEEGSVKNVYVKAKIISLQCFWVIKLFDCSLHDWLRASQSSINKY